MREIIIKFMLQTQLVASHWQLNVTKDYFIVTFTYTLLVITILYVASYVASNVKLMLNKC
jgi:hypothetical protein